MLHHLYIDNEWVLNEEVSRGMHAGRQDRSMYLLFLLQLYDHVPFHCFVEIAINNGMTAAVSTRRRKMEGIMKQYLESFEPKRPG